MPKFIVTETVPSWVSYRKVIEADSQEHALGLAQDWAELDAREEGPLWGDTVEGVAVSYQAEPAPQDDKPKTKMVCAHCGGENVMLDAYAKWNVDTQEWELAATYDHADCEDCGGETRIEGVPAQ